MIKNNDPRGPKARFDQNSSIYYYDLSEVMSWEYSPGKKPKEHSFYQTRRSLVHRWGVFTPVDIKKLTQKLTPFYLEKEGVRLSAEPMFLTSDIILLENDLREKTQVTRRSY